MQSNYFIQLDLDRCILPASLKKQGCKIPGLSEVTRGRQSGVRISVNLHCVPEAGLLRLALAMHNMVVQSDSFISGLLQSTSENMASLS